MASFELNSDEYVVMKSEGVRHGGTTANNDLVLTNKKIVRLSKGFFGGTKKVDYIPLSDVRVVDDRPQAIASDYELEIYRVGRLEMLTFRFRSKKEARAWAGNIADLLLGSKREHRRVGDKVIPGVEFVAESLKDTMDSVKRVFGAGRSGMKRIASDCASCGASITGRSGMVVRCEYCGSDQQMQ